MDLSENQNITLGYDDDYYTGNVKMQGIDDKLDGEYFYEYRRSAAVKTIGAVIAFAQTAAVLC